mgnify:CR=1 FL=1
MSSKNSVFITILFSIAALWSCNNNDIKEKQLAKIDSLISLIDTAGKNLAKINQDTVAKRFWTYQNTNKLVSEHYQKYRNEENWNYVCAFQEVRKPFKTMAFHYRGYLSDIDSSRKQLENLKHDVKEKLVDEKEFENYFNIEAKTVNELTFKINKQVDLVLRQFKNFDTVHPYLLKLLEKYPKDKSPNK